MTISSISVWTVNFMECFVCVFSMRVLLKCLRFFFTLAFRSWCFICLYIICLVFSKHLVCAIHSLFYIYLRHSTLLGALASNIHRCLSYMCRLSWIIIMALTFCGKKSEVGASVCYGHISSLYFDCFYIHVHIPLSFNKSITCT